MIVQVEHGEQTQRAHGQSQLDAKQIVQVVHCFAGQPVFDFYLLDEIGHRVAGGQRLQNISVVVDGVYGFSAFVSRPQHERVFVSHDRVDFKRHQIFVDADELLVEDVTQDGKMSFYAIHTYVLNVHTNKDHYCEI